LRGRVLVVEDEPTVARLIADVLQDEGLDVEVLLDGREGLRRIAERRFDLVICDMRMPGLDGQQFYRQLAKSGSALRHSFLFVTGDVVAPATQAFLEQNHLPHLAKPFRVEELTERVREVLKPSAVGAAQAGGSSRNAARKSAANKP
jgi:CheY-like chemotaxis protein